MHWRIDSRPVTLAYAGVALRGAALTPGEPGPVTPSSHWIRRERAAIDPDGQGSGATYPFLKVRMGFTDPKNPNAHLSYLGSNG